MSAIHLYHIKMLYLLWLLPLLLALFVYAANQRRKTMQIFIASPILQIIPPPRGRWPTIWRISLLLAALTVLIMALARPAWNRREVVVKRSGRDVVFLLDVSRSMLAEDLMPNRLGQAKIAIGDTIEKLQGDRVALVAFAGNAVIKCPLTLDYGFFRLALNNIGPDAISRGGTMIGDALRTILTEVFDDQAKQYKDIILITDGEDHDSFPVEAAKAAADKGVRLIVIGLGSEKEGRRIPIIDQQGRKSFLKYKGHEVWTKLNATTLRQMVKVTPGGRYLPVATGTINLGEVYQQLIASASKKELESITRQQYEEKFQIFLLAALTLLIIEMLISERRKDEILTTR